MDRAVDIKIIKMKDVKGGGPLFEPFPLRLQLCIDRGAEELPPGTHAKTLALLPLSLRFTYFPQLQVVCAMVLIPRMSGSDSTFLVDLFFPNDDGMVSPNPLHHAIHDLESFQRNTEPVGEGKKAASLPSVERLYCRFA